MSHKRKRLLSSRGVGVATAVTLAIGYFAVLYIKGAYWEPAAYFTLFFVYMASILPNLRSQ